MKRIGFFFVFITLIVVVAPPPFPSGEYFFEEGYNPDAFEYFMPAANLALHNKFPYYGFMDAMESYNIHPQPQSVKYFVDTYSAGSMVFVSKPPLYSFLLGISFKYFGFSSGIVYWFNFYCLLLAMLAMFFAGYLAQGWRGVMLALLVAWAWVKFFLPPLFNCDAAMLTTALAVVFMLFAMLAMGGTRATFYFLAGTTLALLMLTKGIFSFACLFFGVWLLVRFLKIKSVHTLKNFAGFATGLAIPILLWMAYINPLLKNNIPNRLAFAAKLEASTPQFLFDKHEHIFAENGIYIETVVEHLNKFHQYQHARENGFVFISNQNGKYNILNVHNEFCTDGDFHPEWRIVKTSFYHSCLDDPNFIKLCKFYSRFPKLGFEITIAKLKNTKGWAALIFYFVLAGLSGLLFTGRLPALWLPGYFLLLSVFLFLIILYGEIRFVHIALPVALLLLAFAVLFPKFSGTTTAK